MFVKNAFSCRVMLTLFLNTTRLYFQQMAELYQEDLPSRVCIEVEIHCWRTKWMKELSEYGQASLSSLPLIPDMPVLCFLALLYIFRTFPGNYQLLTPED